eukprot:7090789-Prymnesium_polylepis.1
MGAGSRRSRPAAGIASMLHDRYGESAVVPPFHTWCQMKRYWRDTRYLSHCTPSGSHVPGGSSTIGRGPGPRCLTAQ